MFPCIISENSTSTNSMLYYGKIGSAEVHCFLCFLYYRKLTFKKKYEKMLMWYELDHFSKYHMILF